MRNEVLIQIRDAQGLTDNEKFFLFIIESRNGKLNNGYYAKNDVLQKDLSWSRAKVYRILPELKKKQLILSTFRGSESTTVYFVNTETLAALQPVSQNETDDSQNETSQSQNEHHKDNKKNNSKNNSIKNNNNENKELEEENNLFEKTGVTASLNSERPFSLLTSSNPKGHRNDAFMEEVTAKEEQDQSPAENESQNETSQSQYETVEWTSDDESLSRPQWYRQYLDANPKPDNKATPFDRYQWNETMEKAWQDYSGEVPSDEW